MNCNKNISNGKEKSRGRTSVCSGHTKHKRHEKLPNSFGTIRYLGPGRRNRYAVHPPTYLDPVSQCYVRPKPICYVDDWYVGIAVLNAYRAGTYKPGDELKFMEARKVTSTDSLNELCTRIFSDYKSYAHAGAVPLAEAGESAQSQKTFAEVFAEFYERKYGEHAKKKLSVSSQNATKGAFKNLAPLHNKVFSSLKHKDFQDCIDACPLRSASIEHMISLIKQMCRYAMLYDICDHNFSEGLEGVESDDEHGVPFSDEELKVLWAHKDDPVVEFILIMCYSGYRITAYRSIEVNLSELYFKGCVKTKAGKGRIVPIHSAIRGLVVRRLERDGCVLGVTSATFRAYMYDALEAIGVEKHTPHDCRHTFSRLCEKYGVNENDRKRMMGHSFGGDITNGIYGHRTVEELRAEIEKIRVE